MRSVRFLIIVVGLWGCGGENAKECPSLAGADFNADTGWNSADYCSAPSELGCFPFHGSSEDTCGPFTTMRTSATSAEGADACAQLITSLNCNIYSDGGDSELTFSAESADRFTMRVTGSYQGRDVDTTFHFNPCQPNCQAAITLDTIAPEQQKICEIPRQGKPVCLFPDSAHSVTFVRADGGSVVLRTAGVESVLDRVENE